MKKFPLLCTILLMQIGVQATNHYVSALTGNNANNGSKASPYKTITKALSVAQTTDSILVEPGFYSVNIGEVFPLIMVSGVKLVGIKGAYVTKIDATTSSKNVMVLNGCNANTLVRGFSIQGGYVQGDVTLFNHKAFGAGVRFINSDSSVFERNIVTENYCAGYQGAISGTNTIGGDAEGAGIFIEENCNSTIRNCVIAYNYSLGGPGRGYGGGFSGDPTPGGKARGAGMLGNSGKIYHNTFYKNIARGGPGGVTNSSGSSNLGNGGEARGGAVYVYSSQAIFENNMFLENAAIGGLPGSVSQNGVGDYGAVYAFLGFSHNLYFNNKASTQNDNGFTGTDFIVGTDPYIHSPVNYHLQSNSVVIGLGKAGTGVTTDFDGASRVTQPTIGAYEMKPSTPTEISAKINLSPGIVMFDNTNVSMLLKDINSSPDKNIRVHYFEKGRTGKINNTLASEFYWSLSTNMDTFFCDVTFDYSSIKNLKLDTNSIKLYTRLGANTEWQELSTAVRVGKTIKAIDVHNFSEFGLGSGDTVLIGINTLSNTKTSPFTLYPNPSNGATNISYHTSHEAILNVYNYLGQKEMQLNLVATQQGLQELTLPKGLYIVEMIYQQKSEKQKLIVN